MFRASRERTAPILVERLDDEPEPLRGTIYSLLSSAGGEAACQRLVRGFLEEPLELRERVGQLLWRQDRAVELVEREQLVPAYSERPPVARRILRLLQEEHIDVPRSWLEGAAPGLLEALGPRLSG